MNCRRSIPYQHNAVTPHAPAAPLDFSFRCTYNGPLFSGGRRMPSIIKAAGLLSLGVFLHAQEYRATLLGVIMDASGAAVPAAAVTVTNVDTGVTSKTQSSTEGNYNVLYLIPGRYSLRVEQTGFKTFERTPIELRTNDRTHAEPEISRFSLYGVSMVRAYEPRT